MPGSNPNAGALVFGKRITGSDVAIGCTEPVAATGTLTLSGNAVAGETVTVGNQTYTWASAISSANNQTPNLVLIAGSASDSIDSLIAAINATAASQGTLYSYNGIPNTAATAAQGAGDTMVVTARVAGADGNQIPTTETMSGGAWGGATLSGGVAAKLSVDATISATAESTAEATAAAPTYVEGQDAPLSQTLAGALRVTEAPNASTTAVTWVQATKTVAATGTPERLAAATTLCESVLLEGKNARATNNTGNVFIGVTSGNDTQLLMIAPGGQLTLSSPPGKKIDLNLIYVDVATNADGITYTAFN